MRRKNKKEQTLREFELQKIRLQNETRRVAGPQTLPKTRIELKKKSCYQPFNPEVENIDLFLTLFERQMKLLDLDEDLKGPNGTCNPKCLRRTDVETNHVNVYAIDTKRPLLTLIDITFCGKRGSACIDIGSSHSIAEEKMY
ncbi:uncharacterized protein NPIL_512821 [Nephila pilipes]|uniref:Uncharacterized protein n=1 Tax=Nephila pilipes TaxID=299642 RepID=A0A8X6UKD5_NEPPI|nr:uncharacterized protein NPIL_512821 [Nephila pilipes]